MRHMGSSRLRSTGPSRAPVDLYVHQEQPVAGGPDGRAALVEHQAAVILQDEQEAPVARVDKYRRKGGLYAEQLRPPATPREKGSAAGLASRVDEERSA